MPNKNYIKGRRKEYKIVNDLKRKGWDIAQRTAGSHSPIDIIAVHRAQKIIKLIQAKPDDFNNKKILEELEWLNGNYKVEFEVI